MFPKISREKLFLLIFIPGLLFFTFLLYKIYIPRIAAFGCFDDCNNFMGGYFLLHGKKLFSEIFFNHAPGMAYISLFIQHFLHPQNLFELILRHRQFVMIFGFLGNLLLLTRFKWKAIGFILFYELSKFYFLGDRFLAEAIIIYPLVYLAGLTWDSIKNKPIHSYEYMLSALFVWFVIFTREPYIPLALFLFAVLMISKEKYKEKIMATSLLIFLSCIALFYHNISAFIFNVYTVNADYIQREGNSSHLFGMGIFQSFFYPIWILISGQSTFLRQILILLNILFLIQNVVFIYKKQYKIVIYTFLSLGLSNLRIVQPGRPYYEAFHMLVWYGIFLFFSFSFLVDANQNKKYKSLFICVYGSILLFLLFSKNSFIHDKINEQTEFITNYGNQLQVGNVVHTISNPKDTLFLDGFDDIIYWVSQRQSKYPYSWYTSLMPAFSLYRSARITMFQNNPPDFYYGSCPHDGNPFRLLPSFVKSQYIQLNNLGKPSCLWVRKSKLNSITSAQWNSVKQLFYSIPSFIN